MNICIILFRISVGLGQAATTLIGKEIGKGCENEAKNYFKIFMIFSSILFTLITLLQYYNKEYII
jgi:Na+-driven multidrug efflux pump